MEFAGVCRECGAPTPAGLSDGLCGRCLFALGLRQGGAVEEQPEEAKHRKTNVEAEPSQGLGRVSAQVGDWIGRYKLLEQLGEGGFGVVYVAEQKEPVKRRVALKIIKLGMDTRQVVARFEAERQALALMDHPGIAKVLDAGATGSGRPYFVMELVRGVPITRYCDENALPTVKRLKLFIQVCRAIQHAHQKGIIHRDIKPSNILITQQDGAAVPKIIDFGIAKATQGELTDQTIYTQFQQFLGTPAYMSPEQADPTSPDVDTRSDIYSLGVLLYELLVGKTPFDPKELRQAGLEQMRRTLVEQDPVRPSTRLGRMGAEELTTTASRRASEPNRLVHLLRGDLDWIVMKCLEKDRSRRYETANGLARDVERHLRDEPVVARPPSRVYEFQKTLRRHKIGFAATAAVILALAAGVVVSTLEAIRARHLQGEAVAARRATTAALWASYLSEARAVRTSGRPGRRYEALEIIRKAAAIRPSPELRNEAIACLALTDVRAAGRKDVKRGEEGIVSDAQLNRYALWDRAGNVSVRRVSDDGELLRLPRYDAGVSGARFSPDGRFIFVPYADGYARVWDLDNSRPLVELRNVWCGLFTPDSRHLLAAGKTGELVVYELPGGTKLKTLSERSLLPKPWASCHAFRPDSRWLAISSEAQTNILLLDTESGKEVGRLPHPANVYKLAWHPNGRHLAAACGDNLVYIWDTAAGHLERTLQGHQNIPIDVRFSHSGGLLVSTGWDQMRLWEYPIGRQLLSVDATGFIADFTADDRRLALQTWEVDRLAFYDIGFGYVRTVHERERPLGNPGGTVVFSSDGNLLAYPTREGVELWDTVAGRLIGTVAGEDKNLLGFDAHDRNLLVAGSEGLFRCPLQLSPAGAIMMGTPALTNIELVGRVGVLTPDGTWLLICGSQQHQLLHSDDLTEQCRTETQPDVSGAGMGLALSPDGKLLARGSRFKEPVLVWEASNGKLLTSLPAERANNVAFSPDSRRLVTASTKELRFWDVRSWSMVLRVQLEFRPPFALAFSPDGKLLAGMRNGTTVVLLEAATGRVLADLEPPNPSLVSGLCFNADGTKLAVCEGRDAVRLWDLSAIRGELARLGLDWELPPDPPGSEMLRAQH